MGEFLHTPEPVVCIVMGSGPVRITTATFAISDPASLTDIEFDDIDSVDARVSTATAAVLPSDICLPEELLARGTRADNELSGVLRSYAAASAWARLAKSVSVIDDSKALLEFFGFQRVRIEIGRDGLDDANAQRTSISMYAWATAEISPDRILAIRQVVSMYGDARVLRSADD